MNKHSKVTPTSSKLYRSYSIDHIPTTCLFQSTEKQKKWLLSTTNPVSAIEPINFETAQSVSQIVLSVCLKTGEFQVSKTSTVTGGTSNSAVHLLSLASRASKSSSLRLSDPYGANFAMPPWSIIICYRKSPFLLGKPSVNGSSIINHQDGCTV